MPRHTPLRDGHPKNLHQDGTIVFRIVLRQARAHRRAYDRDLADALRAGRITSLPDRLNRLRVAMKTLRNEIAHNRAFYAVTNEPTYVYEQVDVEYAGQVWKELVYVGRIAPAVAELREAA